MPAISIIVPNKNNTIIPAFSGENEIDKRKTITAIGKTDCIASFTDENRFCIYHLLFHFILLYYIVFLKLLQGKNPTFNKLFTQKPIEILFPIWYNKYIKNKA